MKYVPVKSSHLFQKLKLNFLIHNPATLQRLVNVPQVTPMYTTTGSTAVSQIERTYMLLKETNVTEVRFSGTVCVVKEINTFGVRQEPVLASLVGYLKISPFKILSLFKSKQSQYIHL